jgi:hypothetical protein
VDVGYAKHLRVNHAANEVTRGASHVNGIESFWSFAKRRHQKFNDVPARTFDLQLKECKYRFNNRDKELSTFLPSYRRARYPVILNEFSINVRHSSDLNLLTLDTFSHVYKYDGAG